MNKINGQEKDETLLLIGEMFIETGLFSDEAPVFIDNNKNDKIEAAYEKGNVYIDHSVPQQDGVRDYRTFPVKKYAARPFELIRFNYDERQIAVPALLLVKSWQGASAEPEGIFFNYKYENINWGKLNNKQKDEYFFEFVKHYLPAGFIEALGSPVQIIIMACITILSGGLLAELQTALAAAGIAMTAIDAKNATGVIIQANNQKEAARTMHEAKRAAKVMAGCIAKLSLDVLDVICTVAGYVKGKKVIKHKEIQSKIGYKDGWNEKKVLATIEKAKAEGKVILPQEYLTESYINSHINSFKNDGVAYLVPKDVLRIYGRKFLGRVDGQFVMKRSELRTALRQANGNILKLEKILGIDKGSWTGKTIVMIEVSDVEIINLRMPSGFETGTNPQWLPGGKLPTGMNEAVCDRIILGNYKETEIWK